MNDDTKKKLAPNRDELTAINDDGSRFIIQPADSQGRFKTWRSLSAYFLIVLYAALPWIPVGGYPAVFLDTEAMRFHFFGLTFASQDLWLAFFLISGLGFGLFYITALLGRIWCGWACPQTVFLEHVYRRIERWIEGNAVNRKKLDKAGWSFEKIWKRGLKIVIFAIVSLTLAHMFMAYFVSIPGLWWMMHQSPAENWSVFLFVFVFASVLFFNFTWFREQLCIVICPYGRLQSALIDEHSMVIGYDEKRGEPRGKAKDVSAGDCIDCTRCVQVCPTGIDIRQGLQLECIGCAACIDACDTVMDKLKRPRGLIRYDSEEGLAGRKTKVVRPRMVLYTCLLLLGLGVLTFSLRGLGDATMTAWRLQGAPYFVDAEVVRNQFMIRVTNKDNAARSYRLEVETGSRVADVRGVGERFDMLGNGEQVKPVIVVVSKKDFNGDFPISVQVVDEDNKVLAERQMQFIGPEPSLLHKE